jgi:hypothetical protein
MMSAHSTCSRAHRAQCTIKDGDLPGGVGYAHQVLNPAAEARVIYERAGWRQVASTSATKNWPSMSVMVPDRREG